MVMSGFAPSKLFETEVDEDRIKERLAAMREAAVFDLVISSRPEQNHARSFGMWERIDIEAATTKRTELLIELVKKDHGLDLEPILGRCPEEVRDAIFEWWDDEIMPEQLPAPPDGVLDEMVDAAARDAAGRAHVDLGSNPERLLDYPQLFLDWVCALIAELVDRLTVNARPDEVCVQVPNVDIPLDEDVAVTLVWGYQYRAVTTRRSSFQLNIPWFGRHVVKRDWMAYARLLAVKVYEDIPEEFDDEEE